MTRPRRRLLLSTIATGLIAGTASSAMIRITPQLELETGRIAGIFDGDSGVFSDQDLLDIHTALWDDGIETDGRVTMLGLETDDGISLVFLIDGAGIGGDDDTASISFQTTAPIGRTSWINDQPDDISDSYNGLSGKQSAWGLFTWNPLLEGDAFAWSDLQPGDGLSAMFAAIEESTFTGLSSDGTFQFLTAGAGGWSVIQTASFSSANYYAFTAQVTPTPGAIALLGIAACRRRRRR
tara:strand:+ start:17687 stop:18400 length:714 start_codon:yes stop_codon:yes gene_type:complete